MARFFALFAAVVAATAATVSACADVEVDVNCYAQPTESSALVTDTLPNPCVPIGCQVQDSSSAGCWLYATNQKCYFKGSTGAGLVPKCSATRPKC
ncbi:hypothetical protein GQ42DRAFT_161091 [Ramicandelaber brevisporus]|nr:hypothetical protein GQ42DRAFT_161091 [Ramicandelaber brevisporus]